MQYILFYLDGDSLLNEILTYIKIYICKVGMPQPTITQLFCLINKQAAHRL